MSSCILIVDDEAGVRTGLGKLLRLKGYRVMEADCLQQAKDTLKKEEIHFVLLDLRLGAESGMELLQEVKAEDPPPLVIVITGYGDVKSAVDCMRAGAVNYITKPIDHDLLLSILHKEEEALRSLRENLAFRESLAAVSDQPVVESSYPEMKRIAKVIDKVKDSEATVLLLGETGTGKEVTARTIHYSGAYRNRPFISVNCAALNDNLLESEMFGHEKGAFTGAIQRKPGRFELAGNGTLFLDEVGDMSLPMQAKLLRVLQERSFERVGGSKTITAHCRILASTNRDLEELIKAGRFREDLYYRISLIKIWLPALRDRPRDIPALVDLFVNEANRQYKRNIRRVAPGVMDRLQAYAWPGNIRQLKNVITNAAILSDGDELAGLDLPGAEPRAEEERSRQFTGTLKAILSVQGLRLEERVIRESLERNKANVSKTAAELGITRKTLYEKMRRHRI